MRMEIMPRKANSDNNGRENSDNADRVNNDQKKKKG